MSGRARANHTGFPDVTVRLHAHACIEIEHRDFRLLIDPWLTGPAFLGAWTQFPPPRVHASELSPDAILITHEHSDHFHEPTLDQFDRSTPVFVPDFPNQRMPRVLDEMGFTDVRPLAFGALAALDEHFSVTAYEPETIWNDAIYLIEVAGFRMLNLNDAGINRRIEPLVCPVDLVIAHSDESSTGAFDEIVELYGASHVLPCGSFYAWWDPEQRERLSTTTSLPVCHGLRQCSESKPVLASALAEPVAHKSKLKQEGTARMARLLPLLPGSSWDAASDEVTHARNAIEPTIDAAVAHCDRTFDADLVDICRQPARMISCDELSNYFLRLNHTPEAVFCEDMTAWVVIHSDDDKDVKFELGLIVSDGRIGITSGQPPHPGLTMTLPLWAVSKVVLEDLSWDELRIGRWGHFDPADTPRHVAFWRMLQAPYFHKRAVLSTYNGGQISHATVMVNIVEQSGPQAERILRRYGLHDDATLRSSHEPLAAAAAEHGLDDDAIERLVGELRRACA
ncbi:MAG: MBL fold metallo-hydrolase [Pirellulales bacterium]|nr:MBL fold metallo-hydrolase [Pirellulales bacterium]